MSCLPLMQRLQVWVILESPFVEAPPFVMYPSLICTFSARRPLLFLLVTSSSFHFHSVYVLTLALFQPWQTFATKRSVPA
jgi:hypothetical protein